MKHPAFVFPFLLLACGTSQRAQTPAPSSPTAASPDGIVTLSPFAVNTDRDTGYQAFSSLAGGRIDTALDRTAAAITVLTREFLDDIAANNFVDAAVWSPQRIMGSRGSWGQVSESDFGIGRL